jgi:hypothetical protein
MNPGPSAFLEILKYLLPSLVVLACAYYIISSFLKNEIEKKRLAIFSDNQKITLPMRLQAYERLTLFAERMDVQNMITRFYTSNSTAQDMQLAMIQSIRTEYEYNLSQQIYVSNEVWKTITSAKEQEVAMINGIASQLPVGTPAKDLVQRLTDVALSQDDDTPRQIALIVINNEAKAVLLQAL